MKKKRILYTLTTIAVIATLVVVISFATDRPPADTPEQKAVAIKSIRADKKAAVKKKSCSCCQKLKARVREQFRKTRERIRSSQQAETKASVSQQPPERASASP